MTQPYRHDSVAPLSFIEELFWIRNCSVLTGVGLGQNLAMAMMLRGRLDADRMRRSVESVVSRFDALHSSFRLRDGVLGRVTHTDDCARVFESIDVDADSSPNGGPEVRRLVEARTGAPFDLANGPPCRFTHFRCRMTGRDGVVFAIDHTVCDAVALSIVWRALISEYVAAAGGNGGAVERYSDYARTQRDALTDAALEPAVEFWLSRLAGLPSVLPLPTDEPRESQITTVRASVEPFDVSLETVSRLRTLAARCRTTLFSVVLTALKMLLAEATGVSDIPILVPVTERDTTKLKHLVGAVMNFVVVRSQIDNATFANALTTVSKNVGEAMRWKLLPYVRLRERLSSPGEPVCRSIYQISFSYVSRSALPRAETGGLDGDRIPVAAPAISADLQIGAYETDTGLRCAFMYNSGLFARERIRDLARRWVVLLERAGQTPDARIASA